VPDSTRFYDIRSGSWLAWANNAAAQYAAIHWTRQQTTGSVTVCSKQTYHRQIKTSKTTATLAQLAASLSVTHFW